LLSRGSTGGTPERGSRGSSTRPCLPIQTDVSTAERGPIAPGPRLRTPEEARETSGATTGLVLEFVRQQAGEPAVAEMLRRAGVPFAAADLARPSHWVGYDTRIRLFQAATDVLGDPATMFRVGREALSHGLPPALVLLIRAIGSPRQVYRQLPKAVAKFSTTSTMEILEAGTTHATIGFRLHEGYVHSRLDCDYVQGLIGAVPTVFGLPPAKVLHDECESDGFPACVYHLTWDNRRRLRWWRHRPRKTVDHELVALREQLRTLQSAAGDLVASDDLDTVLHRIVVRAAQAVLAPAYLLAVSPPAGGPPLVHSDGLRPEDVPGLAGTLLAGGDIGPHAVVVEVASARRSYGRLAAVYRPGDGAIGDERSMLAAYAGHAAAALDLIMALADARLEADRAGALLALAHELAAAEDAAAVCSVVAAALPRVVNCTRAGVLLWDPADGLLRSRASTGMSPEQTRVLTTTVLHPEDTPELVQMLTDRVPRILRDATSSPSLRRLLEGIGSTDVAAVPLLSGTTFLGVAAVGWSAGEAPETLDGDVLARLRGVGDQASTALQKARLLETVRHQATHDTLTGLPNRALFVERLQAVLRQTPADRYLAVLFCDLDRFKEVNDTLGHAAGDELLRQAAARLGSTVRPGDTVGRLSGDEFAVLLPDLARREAAASLAARVASCFEAPFRLEGEDVEVGTSIGMALRSGPGGTVEELLREADAAMYRHKERGRTSAAG
jgi:diguanylate cyclase (GGDEF)-like protein